MRDILQKIDDLSKDATQGLAPSTEKKALNESSVSTSVAGGVAPIAKSFMKTQTRESSSEEGKPQSKKSRFKNSLHREKKSVKESANIDGTGLTEEEINEEDVIMMPGQGRPKFGFIPREQDRTDHEVEMALSDLIQCGKNSGIIYELLQGVSEDEGIEGWVQEKLIKASDYLNTVREYMEGKSVLGSHEAHPEEPEADLDEVASGPITGPNDVRIPAAQRRAAGQPPVTLDQVRQQERSGKLSNLQNLKQAASTLRERSKSKAQARTMAAAAHNPKFAKKVGIPTKVAKEFNRADTGKSSAKLPERVKGDKK